MEKPILQGVLLVAGAIASIGAVAGFVAATRPEFAQVVNVEPVTQTVKVKQKECKDVQASRNKTPKDEHRIAGTVIGGMVGGVIGHQFGNGSGRTVATVAGVAGGAYAGNQVQKTVQNRKTTATHGRRCPIVERTEQKIVAYDVRYRFDGKIGQVRMDHEPGDRIPVRNGKPVLSGAPSAPPDGEAKGERSEG